MRTSADTRAREGGLSGVRNSCRCIVIFSVRLRGTPALLRYDNYLHKKQNGARKASKAHTKLQPTLHHPPPFQRSARILAPDSQQIQRPGQSCGTIWESGRSMMWLEV